MSRFAMLRAGSLLVAVSTIGAVVLAAPASASPTRANTVAVAAPAGVKVVTCTNDVLPPVAATSGGKHYVEFHAYTSCAPKNGAHLVHITIEHRLMKWERPNGKPGWVTVGQNGCSFPGVANSRQHCPGAKQCTPLKFGADSYVQQMFTQVEVEYKGSDLSFKFPLQWQQGDEASIACSV